MVFDDFFMSFRIEFGPKMEPRCLPKWLQNLSKINIFAPGLHFGASWLVLAPFWFSFDSMLVPFCSILGPFSAEYHPFWHPFSCRKLSAGIPTAITLPAAILWGGGGRNACNINIEIKAPMHKMLIVLRNEMLPKGCPVIPK